MGSEWASLMNESNIFFQAGSKKLLDSDSQLVDSCSEAQTLTRSANNEEGFALFF